MRLRPRQNLFVERSLAALCDHGNTLSIASTGFGKTIALSAVVAKSLEGSDAEACILAHRDELTAQNRAKFGRVAPEITTSVVDTEAKGYRGSDGPLHLLVDSTGIKVEGEGEWNARKHGGAKRRVWRKIHIGIDEKTLEIRAAEFTTSDVGDAPMLPELLDQIPPDQEIASVTADGAFDTRKCHDAIAARGATAIIPPRKNAKPWKPDTAGAIARNEILRTSKRVGRTIWRRWSGYHRRSRAETKMHCVKLLGQRLSARDFDRQVAEFQVRVAVLNGFTALGTPITEVAG